MPATAMETHPSPEVGGTKTGNDWSRYWSVVARVLAAAAGPVLYLLYLDRYAVNVPELDEWLRVPLVHAAIHGHLTAGTLWAPYNDGRILIGNLIYAISGTLDHFNIRDLVFLNAGLAIAAFLLFLVLLRTYLGRWPGVGTTLATSVVWFSIANVQNALSGVQAPYIIVVLFVVLVFLLELPRRHRNIWLGLAAVAAVLVSLTGIQGFALWPIGLICLLWHPKPIRTLWECISWGIAATITVAVYVIGLSIPKGPCASATQAGCSSVLSARHPERAIHFLFALVGNIVPAGYLGALSGPRAPMGHELLGAGVLVVAVFVMVQNVRQRRTLPLPLPLVLIAFGLMYDLFLVVARGGLGAAGALSGNHYLLPNLFVALGIVVHGFAQLSFERDQGARQSGARIRWLGVALLSVFIVVQVVVAVPFGIHNGSITRQFALRQAQVVANLDRIPARERGCALGAKMFLGSKTAAAALAEGTQIIDNARQDHLAIFQPGPYHHLRQLGLPDVPLCAGQAGETTNPG